ncbi:beta-1,4-galactosyltransferase galt-1-like [Tribolium madens]|uniref:beta-1,4-galactosyltransferase galt-1-like n=1 Tax=Tribolium madens TaxID=41895 RepID=UPI001CF72E76|nr:beta-1,4-galactosyltransferase galt-1-like [Tribolium madens]
MIVTRRRWLSLGLSVVAVVFCCFEFLGNVEENRGLKSEKNRKIVAFSLKKQIEIESEEVDCSGGVLIEEKSENLENEKWTQLDGTNIFIYSIYLDRRLEPHHYLRIMTMVKGTPSKNLFCQIATSDHHYHVTKAVVTKIWSESWNQNDTHLYFNPYLVSCHLPLNKTSVYLSLNKDPCRISRQKFIIKTPNVEEFRTSFAVCVKPLNFPNDISEHLLQWITINRILGAGKIEFYIETLQKKTRKILETLGKYSNGGLTLHDHKQIVQEPTFEHSTHIWQKRRYEIIAYNDCLYRNIHTSHFVIPLDIDEIIVPRHGSTWAEILNRTEDTFASFTVRNAYYLRHFNVKKSKEKIFFFKRTIRSEFSDEGESGKSFVSTKNALTVFNHYALRSLKPGIGLVKFLNESLVQMNHYKDDCDIVILPECAKYLSSPVRIVDNVIFKYKRLFFSEYEKLLRLIL